MDPSLDESVRRARSGDPRAFRTLADLLGPELIRFLTLHLGGDVHAAHDALQEVFLVAWDSRERFRDGAHFRRWCYQVARCKAVNWIRQRRPSGRRTESLDVRSPDGRRRSDLFVSDLPPPDAEPRHQALTRALRELPPRYAGAVHLYYLQGCSTREAANLLGVNVPALKMRLHRARAFLRDAMQPAPTEETAPDPVGDETP